MSVEDIECRALAYQILGVLAAKCYEYIGIKIIKMLLKKRESEHNKISIVIHGFIWDITLLWSEYLIPLLLHPYTYPNGFPLHSTQATSSNNMLKELYSNVVTTRSMAIISISRLISSGLTDAIHTMLVLVTSI